MHYRYSLHAAKLRQARNWRSCPGDRACLYKHFGGAKDLFCYVNHKDSGSAKRAKPCKIAHLANVWQRGQITPRPMGPHKARGAP